jgi:hypothetical protein
MIMAELTNQEQRGVLFWFTTDGQEHAMHGHFHLMGGKVVARKFRGRNQYHLTDVDSIDDFRLVGKVK